MSEKRDPVPVHAISGQALPDLPETGFPPSGGARIAITGTSERVVDATRQGGVSPDPLDELPGAAPVSVDAAMARVASWQRDERAPLFGLHQIAIALATEVTRLRAEVAFLRADLAMMHAPQPAPVQVQQEDDGE